MATPPNPVTGSITSTIAIDWSGAADDRGKNLWLACCVDEELVELSGGWSRQAVIEHTLGLVSENPDTAVGLDFSFGFPAWFFAQSHWRSVEDMWSCVGEEGEDWLRACRSPLWGRPGQLRGNEEQFRWTERQIVASWAVRPSSTFQIGGAGSVGTGSLRGMPHLLTLRDAGCAVWPFDGSGTGRRTQVVELYPRLLTGPIAKRNPAERSRYLHELRARFPGGATHESLLVRAEVSEDAFDAAVSALGMYANRDRLSPNALSLLALASEPPESVFSEGLIWQPSRDHQR